MPRIELFLALALSMSSFATNAQQAGPPISVDVKGPVLFSDAAKVYISNKGQFPRIVLVKIFNKGGSEILVSEVATTVNARDRVMLEAQPRQNTRFGSSLSWSVYETIGVIRPANKDNSFQIPFPPNVKAHVCQSSDGPQTTHKGGKLNAIDFCATLKTPIAAAKDGTVIEIVQQFTEGGPHPSLLTKANMVRILHDDGLISSYVHIYTNSATVKVGERVTKGQQIALVGNVGYSEGPHLHFEVLEGNSKLNIEGNLLNLVPIRFANSRNETIKIKHGATYIVDGKR